MGEESKINDGRTVYDDALGGSVANDKEVPIAELVPEFPAGTVVGPSEAE